MENNQHPISVDKFEQYENLSTLYHKDLRWDEIRKLRLEGRHPEANHLVFVLREEYGF